MVGWLVGWCSRVSPGVQHSIMSSLVRFQAVQLRRGRRLLLTRTVRGQTNECPFENVSEARGRLPSLDEDGVPYSVPVAAACGIAVHETWRHMMHHPSSKWFGGKQWQSGLHAGTVKRACISASMEMFLDIPGHLIKM